MDLLCVDCFEPADLLDHGSSLCRSCLQKRQAPADVASVSLPAVDVPEDELTDEAAKRRADEQARWYEEQAAPSE